MWLTACTVIAPIPLPIKIPCQIWRSVLKFQAWKVWAVLCKDKGANRITIHFTDFIATVEATGAEHLQQVMVSGNDGPLRLVHWSCNITPGFYWQLEQSFLLLMSFDEKKSYALVNLIRCSFVHKNLGYCMSAQPNNVLCNCIGHFNVKWDHLEIYERDLLLFKPEIHWKDALHNGDCQVAGQRPLIGRLITERRRRKKKKKKKVGGGGCCCSV